MFLPIRKNFLIPLARASSNVYAFPMPSVPPVTTAITSILSRSSFFSRHDRVLVHTKPLWTRAIIHFHLRFHKKWMANLPNCPIYPIRRLPLRRGECAHSWSESTPPWTVVRWYRRRWDTRPSRSPSQSSECNKYLGQRDIRPVYYESGPELTSGIRELTKEGAKRRGDN